MKRGLLVGIAALLVGVSFQASSARNYSTSIDYLDANGQTVGGYWAPCVGPARSWGITTQHYTIEQMNCTCHGTIITPDC